jgi:mannosyltransferase OCH1-like enzyme
MKELERRDSNWVFPYLTIMFSTGPFFASMVVKQWVGSGGREVTGGMNAGESLNAQCAEGTANLTC